MTSVLGVGDVVTFSHGVYEHVGALGGEVVGLGSGRAPAALTLSNGIAALDARSASHWPTELGDIAKSMTVVSVAHGTDHGVAATLLGSLYTWGSNSRGQLGTGEVAAASGGVARVALLEARRIVAVAAGDEHTLALSGECVIARA